MEFRASLAEVLVTGLFIITFVLEVFEIPSGSMEDTLLIGDHLFVNREQFAALRRAGWGHCCRIAISVVTTLPCSCRPRAGPVPGEANHRRSRRPFICATMSCYRNGEKLVEPFVRHKRETSSPYTEFSRRVRLRSVRRNQRKMGQGTAENISRETTSLYLRIVTLPWATTARNELRQPIWGFIPKKES